MKQIDLLLRYVRDRREKEASQLRLAQHDTLKAVGDIDRSTVAVSQITIRELQDQIMQDYSKRIEKSNLFWYEMEYALEDLIRDAYQHERGGK